MKIYKSGKLLVASLFIFVSVAGNAQTTIRNANGQLVQVNSPQSSNGATPGVEGSSAATTATTPSIRDSAQKTSDMNGMTSAISGVMAAVTGAGAVAAAAKPNWPQAALLTAMMLQSIAQMAASSKAAGDAAATAAQVSSLGVGGLDGGVLTPEEARLVRNLQNQLNTPAGINGVRLDPTGQNILTPDGKKYSIGNLTRPGQSLGAGMSEAVRKAALDLAAKAEKDALARIEKIGSATEAMGFNEGGGGGSGSGSSASAGAGAGYGDAWAAQQKRDSLARTPANDVAGMTKNFNGELIGVGADDIFQMIHRRYNLKAEQGAFILSGEKR